MHAGRPRWPDRRDAYGVNHAEIAEGGYLAGLLAKHRLKSALRGIVTPAARSLAAWSKTSFAGLAAHSRKPHRHRHKADFIPPLFYPNAAACTYP